jgi:PAS domain S-box-containing protein
MNGPTILCSSVATACLTLAGVHLFIWSKDRATRANLAFAVLAAGVALFAWCCLLMMRAPTPEAFAWALWWSNVTIFVMVAGVVGFVNTYFRTARAWLGHLAWLLRLITLGAHVVRMPNSDFDHISALQSVSFLGADVSVAAGVPSVWFWTNQISLGLLSWFVIDACYTLWREGGPGEKRRALVIGLPTAAFVLLGGVSAALIFGQVVAWPHVEFIPFLGILLPMGYELSSDVLRAARLTRELQASEAALRESDHRMTLAADAARLGMWMRDMPGGGIWLTDKCREILGFSPDTAVTYELFVSRLHPLDRKRVESETQRALDIETAHQTEYRVALPGGIVRWIASHLRVDRDGAGRAVRMLGICIDVTDQRRAEIAARELRGRLIHAQEDERRRLARDLHDDLSQRLSLLSVDLHLLERASRGPGNDLAEVASRVQELSSEIHKVAYRLHPAKLDQLGLEIAARGWCRDVMQQSGVTVEFAASSVPAQVPTEVALCLYRILQEALRNVVRHSEAATARVELKGTSDLLHLVVSDSGRGFDAAAAGTAAGLGLLSMRERACLLDGSVAVHSRPGAGTRVVVTIPLPAPEAGHGSELVESAVRADGAGV